MKPCTTQLKGLLTCTLCRHVRVCNVQPIAFMMLIFIFAEQASPSIMRIHSTKTAAPELSTCKSRQALQAVKGHFTSGHSRKLQRQWCNCCLQVVHDVASWYIAAIAETHSEPGTIRVAFAEALVGLQHIVHLHAKYIFASPYVARSTKPLLDCQCLKKNV